MTYSIFLNYRREDSSGETKFIRTMRDGVPVEYARPDGSIKGDQVWLVDFSDVRANDWLSVNQFTMIEGQHNRLPDEGQTNL